MRFAHDCKRDVALAIDDKRGWIRCLALRIPSQTVGLCEVVIRVKQDLKVFGIVLPFDKVRGPILQLFRRSWIDENDGRPRLLELVRSIQETPELLCTQRALIAGVTSQHNQYDRSCFRELGQLHFPAAERG